MADILTWGASVVLALQALSSPALDGAFLAMTQLGGEVAFLLLVPLVYWCLDKRFGMRLAVLFLLSGLVNLWLKAAFNTPRPYQADARVRLIGPAEANASFPSGHAQATTTAWVALGRRARRRWLWILGVILIALVALSRMYLGVHYPPDVIGGILFGVIAVAIFARVEAPLSARWAALPFGAQIALSIVLAPALLIVLVDRDTVAATATLAGLSTGYAVQRRWVNFTVGGSAGQRALRYILGTAGVVAIYFVLRGAFGALADEETTLWYVLRFARYGLVGLWAGGLWPMIATRIGLAASEGAKDGG